MASRAAKVQGSIALAVAAACLATATWYSWHPLPRALVKLLAPSPTRLQLGTTSIIEKGDDHASLSIGRNGHYTVMLPRGFRGSGNEVSGELEPSERDRLWSEADAVDWSEVAALPLGEPSTWEMIATVDGKDITVGIGGDVRVVPSVAPLARDLSAVLDRYGR